MQLHAINGFSNSLLLQALVAPAQKKFDVLKVHFNEETRILEFSHRTF